MARWKELDSNWGYRDCLADNIVYKAWVRKGKPKPPSKYGKRLPLRKKADALPTGFHWIGDTICADGTSPPLPKKRTGNVSRGRRHGDPIRRMGLDPSLLSND
jgi:hypothetical protein